LIPGGFRVDPDQFLGRDYVEVNVDAAGAAINDTTVPVDALSGPIPSGTSLYFGASKKFALLTADAAAGATSLTVQALPTALVDADIAYYEPNTDKPIPSGYPMGRTLAERDAGTAFGPAVDSDDEIYLMAFDITDATVNPDFVAVRHGAVIKEDYLPYWGDTTVWPTALVTALRGFYAFQKGGD
jgi:hypothetical protein